MENLSIKNVKSLPEILVLLKNVVDGKIDNGAKAFVTNCQIGAVLQDALSESTLTSLASQCSLKDHKGPYLFLEYNQIKFYIDPIMNWNDCRIICITEVDCKSLTEDYKAHTYCEINVEHSNNLI